MRFVKINFLQMDKHINSPLTATYVGGPTVIIEIGGLRLMTDPTLDPSGASFRLNDKMVETKIAGPATEPGNIDIVLLSHDQHFDNLDGLGRKFLENTRLTLTTKTGATRLGNNTIGLNPWESHKVNAPAGGEVIITATPARHGPSGIEKITGDVIGFIVRFNGSESFELYLTGDTVFYPGIASIAKKYKPSYVFIFAGAARPRGPFNVTMGTNDAIDTAHEFPAATIIPLHSEGWSHYTEGNANLSEAFTILGIRKQLQILQPGVPTKLPI